jgi:hypothetical protein
MKSISPYSSSLLALAVALETLCNGCAVHADVSPEEVYSVDSPVVVIQAVEDAPLPESEAPRGDEPDPSDPTNIDARVGLGYKFTELNGGVSMNEVRAKAAVDIGDEGTLVADVGVGALDSYAPDDDLGLTDGRFRYFHLWEMDRTVVKGYRGWGTSLEIQTQGTVPGTDGSNVVALGALAAFGSGRKLSLFPNLILSSIWSNDLEDHLGAALRGDLIFTYKPGRFWHGAYFKARPSLSYGMTNVVRERTSFDMEASLGGAFTEEKLWWWDVQWRTFFQDGALGDPSTLTANWSLYFSLTHFF